MPTRITQIAYACHRFPPAIIQHAVWLYFRFALSYRDVEDLMAERGIDVSYETVRRWTPKFGPAYAGRIRRHRSKPSDRWHLHEVFLRRRTNPVSLARAGPGRSDRLAALLRCIPIADQAVKILCRLRNKSTFSFDGEAFVTGAFSKVG